MVMYRSSDMSTLCASVCRITFPSNGQSSEGEERICACVTPRSPGRLRAADCSLDSPGVDSCATSRTYHHHLTTEISIMVSTLPSNVAGSSFDSFFCERCSL
ncbi:hypothetical protein CBL_09401 [Carabus blaptoides fortunei]